MKRKQPSSREKNARQASSDEATRETVDLEALRQQITTLVGDDALQMVANTIEQVHQGHYQALKYLFEVIGLFPATATSEARGEDSLAATLLSYLGVSEPSAGRRAESGSVAGASCRAKVP